MVSHSFAFSKINFVSATSMSSCSTTAGMVACPTRGKWLLMGVGSRGLGAELGSGRPAFGALFPATLLCGVGSGGVAGATAIRVRRERWS